MKKQLLTENLRHRLLVNAAAGREIDHVPVVKIFDPVGAACWLLTEMVAPENHDIEPDLLFGLCDLGFGEPELGYVSLAELEAVKGRLGIGLEFDFTFRGLFPISVYAEAARRHSRIVEAEGPLMEAGRCLRI